LFSSLRRREKREEEAERADMTSRRRGWVWRGGTILGDRRRFYKKIKKIYIPSITYMCCMSEELSECYEMIYLWCCAARPHVQHTE